MHARITGLIAFGQPLQSRDGQKENIGPAEATPPKLRSSVKAYSIICTKWEDWRSSELSVHLHAVQQIHDRGRQNYFCDVHARMPMAPNRLQRIYPTLRRILGFLMQLLDAWHMTSLTCFMPLPTSTTRPRTYSNSEKRRTTKASRSASGDQAEERKKWNIDS